MLDTLTALGHVPQDVVAPAFTHLHTDHTGWGFVRDADGKLAQTFPNARYLVTPGHSPGHTSYARTAGDGTRLLVFGDGFHMPGRITHPEWPPGPDVDHDAVRAARQRPLNELETPGTIGFAFHFGDQPFGRATRDDSHMRRRLAGRWKPRWEPP
ncbi:hypothetical protein [Streptomyces mirabilis]|uniref:Metallo-beta-lactamase superfamily protein n=1 Tax=Streptomyces mirabilis TaxID=68239 RepID=A0A1I2VUD4_9ACTN|nr:hypothetical protein [Streptomyces mirabilis]SFG92864.1 hypothetical protein SAMN02787118_13395 [Streptomyces mirabilis]